MNTQMRAQLKKGVNDGKLPDPKYTLKESGSTKIVFLTPRQKHWDVVNAAVEAGEYFSALRGKGKSQKEVKSDATYQELESMAKSVRVKQSKEKSWKTSQYVQKEVVIGNFSMPVLFVLRPYWRKDTKAFRDAYTIIPENIRKSRGISGWVNKTQKARMMDVLFEMATVDGAMATYKQLDKTLQSRPKVEKKSAKIVKEEVEMEKEMKAEV